MTNESSTVPSAEQFGQNSPGSSEYTDQIANPPSPSHLDMIHRPRPPTEISLNNSSIAGEPARSSYNYGSLTAINPPSSQGSQERLRYDEDPVLDLRHFEKAKGNRRVAEKNERESREAELNQIYYVIHRHVNLQISEDARVDAASLGLSEPINGRLLEEGDRHTAPTYQYWDEDSNGDDTLGSIDSQGSINLHEFQGSTVDPYRYRESYLEERPVGLGIFTDDEAGMRPYPEEYEPRRFNQGDPHSGGVEDGGSQYPHRYGHGPGEDYSYHEGDRGNAFRNHRRGMAIDQGRTYVESIHVSQSSNPGDYRLDGGSYVHRGPMSQPSLVFISAPETIFHTHDVRGAGLQSANQDDLNNGIQAGSNPGLQQIDLDAVTAAAERSQRRFNRTYRYHPSVGLYTDYTDGGIHPTLGW